MIDNPNLVLDYTDATLLVQAVKMSADFWTVALEEDPNDEIAMTLSPLYTELSCRMLAIQEVIDAAHLSEAEESVCTMHSNVITFPKSR